MKLHQTQAIVAKDKHRFRIVNCGRRWGKTTLAVEEMKGYLLYDRDIRINALNIPRDEIENMLIMSANDEYRSRVNYFAETYVDARDIAWAMLKKELEPVIKKKDESRLEMEIYNRDGNVSLLKLRGWESVESIRGQKSDFNLLDEVSKYRNYRVSWDDVLEPTLADFYGDCMFVSTPRGFNHFYDLYNLENKDDEYKSYHFTSYDNPYLSRTYLTNTRESKPEDSFAQEYLADFRKTEGLVYKEFNRDTHVFEDPGFEDEDHVVTNTMGGIDFGYANPCAIIQIEVDRDRNYWVYEKLYKTKKTDADIAEYATALKCNEYYPDPENPGGIVELSKRGCNVREVIKGKGSVQNGINIVRELFKQGRLYIHNEAINLIHELETYSYPDKKPYKNEDENPIKENDHACFVAGTIVNGQKIEDIGQMTGYRDVYKYIIANEELITTKDHPVCTQRGFVHCDALRYNDVIWKTKSLYMRVSGGTDIQTVKTGLTGITTAVIKRILEAKGRDCTDLFGKKLMAKSLMGRIFIMLMATPLIMQSIILNVLTALNTLRVIGMKRRQSGLKETLRKPLKLQPIGLKLQRVSIGAGKWEKKMPILSSIGQKLSESAIYVQPSIRQREMVGIGGVTQTVKQKHYVGHVPVYNLRTKSGMYLANGLMVSNCDALRYPLMMKEGQEKKKSVHIHRATTGFKRKFV